MHPAVKVTPNFGLAVLVLRTAIIDRVGYRGFATRYMTEPS